MIVRVQSASPFLWCVSVLYCDRPLSRLCLCLIRICVDVLLLLLSFFCRPSLIDTATPTKSSPPTAAPTKSSPPAAAPTKMSAPTAVLRKCLLLLHYCGSYENASSYCASPYYDHCHARVPRPFPGREAGFCLDSAYEPDARRGAKRARKGGPGGGGGSNTGA